MSTFSEQLEHLISSRAEIINNITRPSPAEGNDLDRITGQKKTKCLSYDVPGPDHPCWPDEKAAAYSVILPPLESFMEVPDQIRKEQFFASFKSGDILVGSVSAFQETGLIITLIACDSGPRRDFDGLKLTGFCPIRQIQKTSSHGNPLDSFQIGDKVRCYILDIIKPNRLILSMHSKYANKERYGDVKFGLISEDEVPLHYKKLMNLDGKSFEDCLSTTPQFQNPDGIVVLAKRFGIPRASTCSLLYSYSSLKIAPTEMGVELRRAQLRALSMKKVQTGVKFFKEGKNTEALQCYNFALEIENTNPDAYVARGALYASTGSYPKAIEDLEKALCFKPNHANAKNYMGQTLIAYANEVQPTDAKKAVEMVRKAIKVNRKNTEARELLKDLTGTGYLSDEDKDNDREPKSLSHRERNARAWSGDAEITSGKKHRSGMESPHAVSTKRSKGRHEEVNDQKSSKGKNRDYGSPNRMDESPIDRSNDSIEAKKGDYSKLAINRDRSGKNIKHPENPDRQLARIEPGELDRKINYKMSTRRVFTPPKDVQVLQDGTLTKYQNVNDLPSSSKVLQERVQAKLAAIEKRHRGDMPSDEDDHFSDDPSHFNQPRANIWAPPSQYDKRNRGGNDRFNRGGRDNFRYNNGPPRDNFRSRPFNNSSANLNSSRGQWTNDDRRRDFQRGPGTRRNRPLHHSKSDARRSNSRSRSRSFSGSPSKRYYDQRGRRDKKVDKKRSHKSRRYNGCGSSSRSSSRQSLSPMKRNSNPKNSGITRAVLEAPELPSLAKVDRISRDDSNAMDEVNNFVAQLKAKRAALGDVIPMETEEILPPNPNPTVIGPQKVLGNESPTESESESSSSSEEETDGEEED